MKKCKACYGKGHYTQAIQNIYRADFIGDKESVGPIVSEKRECSRCSGSGNEPVKKIQVNKEAVEQEAEEVREENRAYKIRRIEEEMADKTLSFGCRGILESCNRTIKVTTSRPISYEDFFLLKKENKKGHDTIRTNVGVIDVLDIEEVYGHPVMIGDVLDWVLRHKKIYRYTNDGERRGKMKDMIMGCRDHFRKPIDNQSEETISFVYDLISGDK